MSNTESPLDLLQNKYLPEGTSVPTSAPPTIPDSTTFGTSTVQCVEGAPPLPVMRSLGDLRSLANSVDENELFKYRFLCKKRIGIVCGPTGIGKSSWIVQSTMLWSVGGDFFGITPADQYQSKGMNVLIIQAENDDVDLAEMCDGVLRGCEGLSPAQQELAQQRIQVCSISDRTGAEFVHTLDRMLSESSIKFDLVIIDPVLSFLGGDCSKQTDVSRFLRNQLTPLIQRHNVGLILVHHTNKPGKGKQREEWVGGEHSYSGAGSAEFANTARAVIVLREKGPNVFELRAAKRGSRLRWKDGNGDAAYTKHLSHDTREGFICWQIATAEAVAAIALAAPKAGRPKEYDDIEVVHALIVRPDVCAKDVKNALEGELLCESRTVTRMIKACKDAGWITQRKSDGLQKFVVTPEGRSAAEKTPSKIAWPTDEED